MAKIGYLGLGVLVIIAIVGFMVTRRSEPTQTQQVTTEPADTYVIKYNADGFDITGLPVNAIVAGDSVTFKNESSEQLWVASDPHPIHTGLRGFDAKNGIGNGQTYSFTFTKAGRFGFHNHLNPSHTGTVVVE